MLINLVLWNISTWIQAKASLPNKSTKITSAPLSNPLSLNTVESIHSLWQQKSPFLLDLLLPFEEGYANKQFINYLKKSLIEVLKVPVLRFSDLSPASIQKALPASNDNYLNALARIIDESSTKVLIMKKNLMLRWLF